MSTTETPQKATERIVIVSGNEYRVPLTATEKELREHLAGMFPDVTNATLQKGKRTVGGVEYETWEFVKRAGTKGGLTGGEIARLLTHVLPVPITPLTRAISERLAELRRGTCTIHEALESDLIIALDALPVSGQLFTGGTLCALLDTLPAVAGSDDTGW